MAKATKGTGSGLKSRSNSRKRPGVHAKKKKSVNKSGKNWKKDYRGQGR
jgi:hypothetical protein